MSYYRCHLMRRVSVSFPVQGAFQKVYLLQIFPVAQMQVVSIWANFTGPNSVPLVDTSNVTITLVDNNDRTIYDQLPLKWLELRDTPGPGSRGRQRVADWMPWPIQATVNWERSFLTFAQSFVGEQFVELGVLYLTV